MKKEIGAAVLLSLLIILSLFNCAYISKGTEIVCAYAGNAKLLAQSGDLTKADRELQKGRELLLSRQRYAGIFLRCDETAEITDIFFDAEDAAAKGDGQSYAIICDRLCFKLRALADMEKIRLHNIF